MQRPEHHQVPRLTGGDRHVVVVREVIGVQIGAGRGHVARRCRAEVTVADRARRLHRARACRDRDDRRIIAEVRIVALGRREPTGGGRVARDVAGARRLQPCVVVGVEVRFNDDLLLEVARAGVRQAHKFTHGPRTRALPLHVHVEGPGSNGGGLQCRAGEVDGPAVPARDLEVRAIDVHQPGAVERLLARREQHGVAHGEAGALHTDGTVVVEAFHAGVVAPEDATRFELSRQRGVDGCRHPTEGRRGRYHSDNAHSQKLAHR